jgi:formylmethanofuran dehydrogenase subunit D
VTFILNTGRTVTQGRHVEHKYHHNYFEEASCCFIHPMDLMDLDMEEGEHVEVTSEWGSVVLRTVSCEDLRRGMVFVPMGPFANHIIPPRTHSTGMPDFKSIPVELKYTDRPRPTQWDLMEAIGGKRYEKM